jgi:hypothetical protein
MDSKFPTLVTSRKHRWHTASIEVLKGWLMILSPLQFTRVDLPAIPHTSLAQELLFKTLTHRCQTRMMALAMRLIGTLFRILR